MENSLKTIDQLKNALKIKRRLLACELGEEKARTLVAEVLGVIKKHGNQITPVIAQTLMEIVILCLFSSKVGYELEFLQRSLQKAVLCVPGDTCGNAG